LAAGRRPDLGHRRLAVGGFTTLLADPVVAIVFWPEQVVASNLEIVALITGELVEVALRLMRIRG
jgi:hypothetical protein